MPLLARLAADMVVILHLFFIVFVVFGGLLLWRWPRLPYLHLPAALWGAVVEINGWLCPLTPLEQRLRLAAGQGQYSGGFVDRYLVPLVYPPGLTRPGQIILGLLVVTINLLLYGFYLFWQRRHRKG